MAGNLRQGLKRAEGLGFEVTPKKRTGEVLVVGFGLRMLLHKTRKDMPRCLQVAIRRAEKIRANGGTTDDSSSGSVLGNG